VQTFISIINAMKEIWHRITPR